MGLVLEESVRLRRFPFPSLFLAGHLVEGNTCGSDSHVRSPGKREVLLRYQTPTPKSSFQRLTPWKINMKPENKPLENDLPLPPGSDFQVPSEPPRAEYPISRPADRRVEECHDRCPIQVTGDPLLCGSVTNAEACSMCSAPGSIGTTCP